MFEVREEVQGALGRGPVRALEEHEHVRVAPRHGPTLGQRPERVDAEHLGPAAQEGLRSPAQASERLLGVEPKDPHGPVPTASEDPRRIHRDDRTASGRTSRVPAVGAGPARGP